MGWEALEGRDWERWLLAVAGGSKAHSGRRLDPFGTSWRVLSRQGKLWLSKIRAGEPIPREVRVPQAWSDLGSVDLVVPKKKTLTPFGEAVLDRWQDLPGEWTYELPLALGLLQEGIARDADGFRGMVGFWWDIKQVLTEEDLFDHTGGETLMLLSYLNQEVDGFNPWVTVREGDRPDPSFPWNELETREYAEPDRARGALNNLRGKLDPSRRLKPRIVFCRAMSLMLEHREGKTAEYLEGLELPHRASR